MAHFGQGITVTALQLRMLGCFVVFALRRADFFEGWADIECSTRHMASLAHFLSIWPETTLERKQSQLSFQYARERHSQRGRPAPGHQQAHSHHTDKQGTLAGNQATPWEAVDLAHRRAQRRAMAG